MIPEEVVQWTAGIAIPAGGALFLFLLKRTFSDFEGKITRLFGQMEKSLIAQQDHDTRLQLMDQRITFIERHHEWENRNASRPGKET